MKCKSYFMGKDPTSGLEKYSAFFYYEHDNTLVSGLLSPSDDFVPTFQDDYFKNLDPTGTQITFNRTLGSFQNFKIYTS